MLWYHLVTIYKRHLVKVLPLTSLLPFTKKDVFNVFNVFNFSFNSMLFSKNTFQNFLILFKNYLKKHTKHWFQWT